MSLKCMKKLIREERSQCPVRRALLARGLSSTLMKLSESSILNQNINEDSMALQNQEKRIKKLCLLSPSIRGSLQESALSRNR